MGKQQEYWFKAKHYGWGWYPSTWQGWLSLVVFVIAVLTGSLLLLSGNPKTYGPVVLFLVWVGICTTALTVVSYKKGEKPKWHWGN